MGWRKSIRKSLGRTQLVRKKDDEENSKQALPALSNEIVVYKGISLSALKHLRDGLLDGTQAKGVRLLTLEKDVQDVRAGQTVEETGRLGLQNGKNELVVRVPQRKGRLVVKEKDVKEKERKDWSIEDVCEFLVLPDTLRDDSVFLDNIGPEAVGDEFQGAFVSQARKSSFHGLVAALERHYEGLDAKKVFLWLDLFSANQPMLTRKDRGLSERVMRERYTLLNSGLHEAIKNFDECLIFFNAWDQPYPLQRAWCIWEIYGAAISGKDMFLLLDDSAKQDMLEKLLKDSKALINAVSDLDPRTMQCYDPKDLEMIQAAVERLPGGFSQLKSRITTRLRRWMLETVESAVKEREPHNDYDDDREAKREYGDFLNQAGLFMLSMDETHVAQSYLEHACELFTESYGTSQHRDVGMVLANLGIAYDALGQYDLALKVLGDAVEIQKDTHGARSHKVAETYNNIGNVLSDKGKYEQALEMYQAALAIKQETLGESHPSTADTLNNMAMAYEALGRFDLALEMLEQALAVSKATLGERHPSTADTYNNIAGMLFSLERYDAALEMYENALSILRETLGEEHPETVGVLSNVAILYNQQNNCSKALELFNEVLELQRRVLGNSHPTVAATYNNMGLVYKKLGQFDVALKMYSQALEIRKERLGENHPETAATFNNMAIVLKNQGKFQSALKMFEKALHVLVETMGTAHPSIAEVHYNVGLLFEQQRKWSKAQERYAKAAEVWSSSLGALHPNTVNAEQGLARVASKTAR